MRLKWCQVSAVCVIFSGTDIDARRSRHAIARYVNLASVLAWRNVSPKIRERFPSMKHIVDAGLMTPLEYAMYNNVHDHSMRWFLPLQWCQRLIERRMIEKAAPPPVVSATLEQLHRIRNYHRKLLY